MNSFNKLLTLAIIAIAQFTSAYGAVYNLKVVTDASPDYSDMPSMIHSITGKWQTPAEKCWALFYWNHIARRQTTPMVLHGLAVTDPIRQFNDYGYTMCSTIAGINCSIWSAMGLETRYWDISNHTVSEVRYGGRWHMYDNSMSAIYTLCDGVTIAGVEDIGKSGACPASAGKTEPGHIARYHCLNATSSRGFLTGADTIRSLEEEYRCFRPSGLKYRSYFYDWDRGHRYILNLRDHEAYTRCYHSLGKSAEYFTPNRGKDPESVNERYRIRGNGRRVWKPALDDTWQAHTHSYANMTKLSAGGVQPSQAKRTGDIIFKVEGANVITSLKIRASLYRETSADLNRISISLVNGLVWQEVWQNDQTGETPIELKLVDKVNGAYEVLVKVSLRGESTAVNAQLKSIEFETITMLNSKTQARLNLGKNSVYVGVGAQTESIVFWPDLRGENYKPYVVDEENMITQARHPGYQGVMHAVKPDRDAWVVFAIDAPRRITSINYGGRLYNRAPGSHIDFLHSFDRGRTWIRAYSLSSTDQPWDVIHYETVEAIPADARSVWFKYLLNSSAAGPNACSLYAVRMELNHEATQTDFRPFEVTFNWSERQANYSLVERSHSELISHIPHRYTINVGGADHPVVNWMRLNAGGENSPARYGYADGKNLGGDKFVPNWVTYGKNLARDKPYTVSIPSGAQWGAGDPDGRKLTDGVVGPPYPGGIAPRYALCWSKGQEPDITVDLGHPQKCGAFAIQLGAGWPWWDALKGEVKDQVEVQLSLDGRRYISQGFFDLNLRWKDLPVNHFWPDEEVIGAHLFSLVLPNPQEARYVRFRITPQRTLTVSEVQVLDFIRYEPFDLRLALPDAASNSYKF
jgi:hypothetical protein